MMAIRLWTKIVVEGNGNPVRLPSPEITFSCRVSHKWFPSSGNYSCWNLGQGQIHVSHASFFIHCPFGAHTPSEKGRDNLHCGLTSVLHEIEDRHKQSESASQVPPSHREIRSILSQVCLVETSSKRSSWHPPAGRPPKRVRWRK